MDKQKDVHLWGLHDDLRQAENRWLDEDLAQIRELLDKDYTAQPRDISNMMPRLEQPEEEPALPADLELPEPEEDDQELLPPLQPRDRKPPKAPKAPKEPKPRDPGKLDWTIPVLAAVAGLECVGIAAVILWWVQWM